MPSSPAGNTLQVMAVVNGEQITRTDLGRECIRRYGEEVLESMVNRHLIADACAQKGIQVTDADVSAEIDKIAGRFGLSRDRWLALLREERGFSEEQYRREVVWPMLALRQVAATQIEVTDAEMKKAFESEFGQKVRARLIAVDSQQKAAAGAGQGGRQPEFVRRAVEATQRRAGRGLGLRRHSADPQAPGRCATWSRSRSPQAGADFGSRQRRQHVLHPQVRGNPAAAVPLRPAARRAASRG